MPILVSSDTSCLFFFCNDDFPVEPTTMEEARAGIPVTMQRRFDVYPDVSESGKN